MTTFNIFHTTRVRIGVRDAPHIWGAGEIRDAGERRLFGGLARSEPFVTPHVWGTGEMSTEISATYLGRWGNKHWKSRRIYVALGHDELRHNDARIETTGDNIGPPDRWRPDTGSSYPWWSSVYVTIRNRARIRIISNIVSFDGGR